MTRRKVRALLMGGQACVLYGAAEFSRDLDLAVVADVGNLLRLRGALDDLQAEVIAVPPFDANYLERGHAVHFRCRHPDVPGLCVDVMAKMRGVAPFCKTGRRRRRLGAATKRPLPLPCTPKSRRSGSVIASTGSRSVRNWNNLGGAHGAAKHGSAAARLAVQSKDR